MAITKRYIISGGEDQDEPEGVIELEPQFSYEHDVLIAFVARQSTPQAAPDEVKIWLTREQALELAAALRSSAGIPMSAEDAVLLWET